ncbi:hypothetical protein MMC25_008346 [Agyrium rufum]|nr:hypothetical protein [Agyrium rufum]
MAWYFTGGPVPKIDMRIRRERRIQSHWPSPITNKAGVAGSSNDTHKSKSSTAVQEVPQKERMEAQLAQSLAMVASNNSTPNKMIDSTDLSSGTPFEGCRQTIASFKAGYLALSTAPASWGCFEYTAYGELVPGRFFTVAQMSQYILNRPDTAGELTLYIQRAPVRMAKRRPHPKSWKCRFLNCPASNNPIEMGHTQVAFSELRPGLHVETPQDQYDDPIIVAGNVHLYCLERFLDIPAICRSNTLRVKVDDRIWPREPDKKYRVQLSTKPEKALAENFLAGCASGKMPRVYPQLNDIGVRLYEGTLAHRIMLTKSKTCRDMRWRRRVAELRGIDHGVPSIMEKHLGDLKICTQARHLRRLGQKNGGLCEPYVKKSKPPISHLV